MNRAKLILYFTLLLVLVHLMFSVVYTNLVLVLLGLSILIDNNIGEKLASLFKSKQFWILLLPFMIFCVSSIYSENSIRAWKEIEIKLPLLIFPFFFGLVSFTEKQKLIVLKFFIRLTILIPIIGFIIQIGAYLETKDSGFFYNDNLVSYVGKQAAYFALYVNVSLVGVLYFWNKSKSKFQKSILGTSFLLLIIIQYLLASRMAILLMVLLILGFLITQLITHASKKRTLIMFAGFFLAIIGLTILFPKVLKRFDSVTHFEYKFDNTNPINHFNGEIKAENWNGLNTRLALWECAIDVIKKAPIIGTGIGDVQQDLVSNYKEKNFIFALESNYNTHNQYLDIALSNGILGLIAFLGFIIYLINNCYRNKNWLLMTILIVFLLSFFTENILNRNQGVVLFSLFVFILVDKAQFKNKKT